MKNRKVANFTAVEEDNIMVMTGRDNQGQTAKNTFYNVSEDSFDWLNEWTMDAGESWFPIARIHCERKK